MYLILYFSFLREKYAITLELVGNVIYSLSLDYSKWLFLSAGDTLSIC